MERKNKLVNTQKVKIEELENKTSKQIASSVSAFGKTVEIIETSKDIIDREILFLQFFLDIPNNPVNDIQQKEIIKIVTFKSSSLLPQVFAIREDFPIGLPHTNVTKDKRPISLCVFEENFEELKHKWSGAYFLQSIKVWLELTAINQLHQENQPLEPFIIGSNGIIINPNNLFIKQLSNGFYKTTDSLLGTPIHRLFITTPPVENGVVHQTVDNLYSLQELFKSKNIDLLSLLKPKIIELVDSGIKSGLYGDFWKGIIFLIVEIPIVRNTVKSEPTLAGFKINATLSELSTIFGRTILGLKNLIAVKENLSEHKLTPIKIEILSPHLNLNKTLAQNYSGINNKSLESKISLIGLGAIGSQFFMNLARSGFGIWNLIDKDIMLPHNFIRHASTDVKNHMALNKAKAISSQANDLLDDSEFSKAFDVSIYDIDKTVLLGSDIIIDMSTSIGVERYLANEIKGVRKLSSFLNPMGTDFVMLSEDNEGIYPLDILEIQYYKELLSTTKLSDHLKFEQEGRIRYARGCRDITSKIPQENLSIFSGIATKAFKKKISENEASIDIWQIEDGFIVDKSSFKIDDWIEETINGWTIFINKNSLLNIISPFRNSKLPNETGGIFIGAIDSFYKKIYIVETILSPEDSIERPTLFIRGINGVSQKLGEINEITNDNLKYLGEWHSHPKNCGLGMSTDDKKQFSELKNEAKLNGQPAIMLILGDDDKFKIYLDNYE